MLDAFTGGNVLYFYLIGPIREASLTIRGKVSFESAVVQVSGAVDVKGITTV